MVVKKTFRYSNVFFYNHLYQPECFYEKRYKLSLDIAKAFQLVCMRKVSKMKTYDDCIIFLLAKAYQKAHGDFKKRLQDYSLTPIQHLILEVLWGEDGLSASDIGKKLVLDGATLSGVLDRLNAGGWILKETDSDDKRVLRNYLTPKSIELKPKLSQARDLTNEELLKSFSLEEKMLLKRFLRDMQ